MASEHLLVTGAAGFIGSHLTEKLLGQGYRVTGIDALDPYYDPALKRANVARFEGKPGYRFIEGDITREKDIKRLGSAAYDHIIHLAGRVGVRASLTEPEAYIQHNIRGTQRMLEYARHALKGCFVFASSSSVYGDRTDAPFSETDNTDHPETVYAASKKAGELAAYAYHKLYGIPSVCLRLFTVYGPRQRPEMAIAKFARLILLEQPLPVLGELTSARDYTYVEDTCDGLIAAMKSQIAYGVYNLGCGQPVTLERVIKTLGVALGKTPHIDPQPKANGDVFLTYANIAAARKDLKYEPKIDFAEGIRRYVASLEAQAQPAP
ncbi:MAG: NAD-dependent epimerase/dehydratase family protein [Planctomycetota bacterium]